MRAIKLNDVLYNIPTSWEELSLGEFERITPILEKMQDEPVKLRGLLKIVCNLLTIPQEVLLEAPKSVFNLIVKELDFLFDSSRQKYKAVKEVKIGGVKHYFPTEASAINTGQFIDIEEMIQQPELYSNILAILLLPAGAKHNAKDFYSRKDKIKGLPMSEALPLINFFLSSGENYIKTMQGFLMAKTTGLQHLQRLESLVKNGDGIAHLRAFQRMTYLKWIQLLKSQLLKC
jgi:hypothetical protein